MYVCVSQRFFEHCQILTMDDAHMGPSNQVLWYVFVCVYVCVLADVIDTLMMNLYSNKAQGWAKGHPQYATLTVDYYTRASRFKTRKVISANFSRQFLSPHS